MKLSLTLPIAFWKDIKDEHTQYKINVEPINEEISINPDYTKIVGVELTGDLATDFTNLNRTCLKSAPKIKIPDKVIPNILNIFGLRHFLNASEGEFL